MPSDVLRCVLALLCCCYNHARSTLLVALESADPSFCPYSINYVTALKDMAAQHGMRS
jgi:hypothetical protein